jgi:hypothetical protein
MRSIFLLPAFIAVAGATTPPLLAQAPAEPAAADRCAAVPPATASGVKKKAMFGFARSLAGNLPMLGHGSALASIAGQTASVALEAQASADAQHTAAAVVPCGQG